MTTSLRGECKLTAAFLNELHALFKCISCLYDTKQEDKKQNFIRLVKIDYIVGIILKMEIEQRDNRGK